MQIVDHDDASGRLALASRKILAGELVLATTPLVCVPNLEKIKNGSFCIGCLAPITTSSIFIPSSQPVNTTCSPMTAKQQQGKTNNNSKTNQNSQQQASSSASFYSCPACHEISTFCSKECYNTHRSFHINSGECNAIMKVVSANHTLKGPVADSLLMMSVILARAEAELKMVDPDFTGLPQDAMVIVSPSTRKERSSNKTSPSSVSPASASSVTTTPHHNPSTPVVAAQHQQNQKQKQQEETESENSSASTSFPVVPKKNNKAKPEQEKKSSTSNKKKEVQEKDDDDDEEEEEEDDDDDNDSFYQQLEANKSRRRGKKKNNTTTTASTSSNKKNKKKNKPPLPTRMINDGTTTTPSSPATSSSCYCTTTTTATNSLQHNAASSSSATTTNTSTPSSSLPITPTTTRMVSSQSTSLPIKVAADIQRCQQSKRTCLKKEFPEVFSLSDTQTSLLSCVPSWSYNPQTSTAFQHTRMMMVASSSSKSNNNSTTTMNSPLLLRPSLTNATEEEEQRQRIFQSLQYDAEQRRSKLLSLVGQNNNFNNNNNKQQNSSSSSSSHNNTNNQTFIEGFANLISNHSTITNSASQNHYLTTVETLRRKYNNIFNTNIDRNLFYHAYSVYCCNAFGFYSPLDDAQFAQAMYPTASFFNHSCSPNLCRRMDCGGKGAFFYACRDIEEGECLTISYCDTHSTRNTMARRIGLLDGYRFWCLCPLCEPSSSSSSTTTTNDTKNNNNNHSLIVRSCSNCAAKGIMRPIRSGCSSNHNNADIIIGYECQCCFIFEHS